VDIISWGGIKTYFSLNATKTILGMDGSFRLQQDGTWIEKRDFTKFDNNDMLFNSFTETQTWLEQNRNIAINGEISNPSSEERVTDLFSRSFHFDVICHRTESPLNPVPSIEQLRDVLVNGDDTTSNTLIIDFNGHFNLVPRRSQEPLRVKNYAVKYETFQAGNGYVGSSSNLLHLEQTYQSVLEHWLLHLESGKQLYADYAENKQSVEQLIEAINEQILQFS